MVWRSFCAFVAAVGASLTVVGQAAAPTAAPSPQQEGSFTLKMYSRAVLTDVTVTDKQGNPVTGLTEKDFQIFDNGRPQTLTSFEEHHEQLAKGTATRTAPGVFSNDFLRNAPPQVNVLLFDTTTVRMLDQMFLYQEMTKFINGLPAGQPVAIFTRWGDYTLQLSGFTDDHAALMMALRRAIPKFRQPGHWASSDVDTMRQMAIYLSQVPGRKNLIWFTGGSNQILLASLDPEMLGVGDMAAIRQMYDMLESERIALYPVNARGLTVYSRNTGPWQKLQMLQDAQATGGKAFINTNGFAQAAQKIIAEDGNYYTLMYYPQDLKRSGKWHRVEVKLDRKGYQLSYRRGYFDDGSNPQKLQEKARADLKAKAEEAQQPNNRSNPIVFTVQVAPQPAGAPSEPGEHPVKHGQQRYEVRFYLPARDVTSTGDQSGQGKAVLGSGVLAFNRYGSLVTRRMQEVTMMVNEAKLHSLADPHLDFTETVDLPKGRNYLYVAVWDTVTERVGTVNAEVEVGNQKKQH